MKEIKIQNTIQYVYQFCCFTLLLTYKFVTFPKYEFKTFSQNFRTIDFCWVCFTCTFWNPRSNFSSWTPFSLFSVAVKRFELLTQKFVTFTVYKFTRYSYIFSSIEYTLHALDDILIRNVPSLPCPVISVTGLKW